MPDYRRHRVPGGTYFFTLALADRRSDLLVREIDALRAAVARTKRLYPFGIDAWVVLPDHMHAVWTLPDGDAAYSVRWALIRRWFSAAVPPGENRSASRAAKGERGLWQRRFWEHTVRDAEDFSRHVDYIHFNPVKHGVAVSAAGIAEDRKGFLFRTSPRHAAHVLTEQPMSQADAWRMIRRRAVAAAIMAPIGNHSFRATGITAYLANGGALKHAQAMAAHESPRTTKLYDRTQERLTQDEVERIRL